MAKRRADADSRRFIDDYPFVKVSRLRATGVIDPMKREALIPFPNGRIKLIHTAHTRLKYGGGWSFFLCPRCMKLTTKLILIEDTPLCSRCCGKQNIVHRSRYGFGRAARLRSREDKLDEVIAKLETTEPLMVKQHASWHPRRRMLDNSRKLTLRARRSMVELRLSQLVSLHSFGVARLPISEAKRLMDMGPILKARTFEELERALDTAQAVILQALQSNDPEKRQDAAALMMLRTREGRRRLLGNSKEHVWTSTQNATETVDLEISDPQNEVVS